MRKRMSADARHRYQARQGYDEIIRDHEITKALLDNALTRTLDAEQALAVLASGGDPLAHAD